MAEALGEAGANVVLCSRKIDVCLEVSESLKEIGVDSISIKCDVREQDEVNHVVNETVKRFGHIDILINNSGTSWGSLPEDIPLDKWQKVMDVNVTGTFLMCQAVGKEMIKQKSGKIINIASIAGLGGVNPNIMNATGYNASKGAVVAYTKDLAVKWAEHNIYVNAIAPGFFPTKMAAEMIENTIDYIRSEVPLRRPGSHKEIKGAAVYLASDASNYVTGHVLVVDGGFHAK